MPLVWPFKDPQEVLDYRLDWSERLDGDVIVASTWTIDTPGLTEDSNSFSATATTIWLSGGTLDETYLLTNHITTQGDREMDQTVKLKLKAK